MGATWMCARADLRRRRPAIVSAALLVGLFGGAVLSVLAGAQRTQTAYPRFLERQRASDVQVYDSTLFADVFWKPDFPALEALPYVETAVPIVSGSLLPGGDLPEGGTFTGSTDPGFGVVLDRPVLVRGRFPDPRRADEVTIPYFAEPETSSGAPSLGRFRTGDRIRVMIGKSLVPLSVVGETIIPGEFPPTPQFGWTLRVTPAFIDRYATDCVAFRLSETCGASFALRVLSLRFHDPSDVVRFEMDLQHLAGGKVVSPVEQASQTQAVEGSTDLQASALRLLGLFIAIAGAMILGQLFARETTLAAVDVPVLRALGAGRAQVFGAALLRVVPAAIAGASIAVGAAWAGSALFPRGSVRAIEPSAWTFDTTVLLIGGLLVAILPLLLVVIPAWRIASMRPGRGAPSRPSVLAGLLKAAGLPASAIAGARLALERGRGRTAVPVVSSLAVVCIGIASFVGATTFAASLQAVIDRPALRGVTWDQVLDTADVSLFQAPPREQIALTARIARALVADPDVAALANVDSGAPLRVYAEGGPERGISVIGLSIANVKGSLFSPVVEGRDPTGVNEVVLGPRMIHALGIHLDPDDPPAIQVGLEGVEGRRATLQVVGRAVIPPLGDFGKLGYGIMFGPEDDLGDQLLSGDAEIPPQTDLLVRWREGADPEAVVARYHDRFPSLSVGEGITGGRFADAVNFGGVQGAPLWVSGVLAALGAAALAHVLVTAIRRRRRDIAVLKTLGFVRRQARGAVAWQASIIGIVASLIGIPLGIVVGRVLWIRVADGLGVLPRPQVSVIVVAVLLPVVVVLSNVIAAIPARIAARTQPAVVLRSE